MLRSTQDLNSSDQAGEEFGEAGIWLQAKVRQKSLRLPEQTRCLRVCGRRPKRPFAGSRISPGSFLLPFLITIRLKRRLSIASLDDSGRGRCRATLSSKLIQK